MFKEQKGILAAWIVGGLLIALLAYFILSIVKSELKKIKDQKEKLNMKRQFDYAILQSQIEVHESNFSVVNQELHDNIGQLLSTAKVLLGITEIQLMNPPDTLLTANATIGEAIRQLRSLSRSLDKEWMERFNLIENLRTEVNRINQAHTVSLHMNHDINLKLDAEKQLLLFRMVQEAITNAVRHSSGKNVFISISAQEESIIIRVNDDGKGFNKDAEKDGAGISNIKNRAKLLSGTVNWYTGKWGSAVIICIPNN